MQPSWYTSRVTTPIEIRSHLLMELIAQELYIERRDRESPDPGSDWQAVERFQVEEKIDEIRSDLGMQ